MPRPSDPREDVAFDAVVAYSLAGRNPGDLSDEEVERLAAELPELSAEARALLQSMGDTPFSQRAPTASPAAAQVREVAGMYRAGSDEGLSPELRAEIERKRAEIRDRLRRKPGRDV